MRMKTVFLSFFLEVLLPARMLVGVIMIEVACRGIDFSISVGGWGAEFGPVPYLVTYIKFFQHEIVYISKNVVLKYNVCYLK